MNLTEEQKEELKGYEVIKLTSDEFKELKEYSITVPTQSGSVGIKKWKHRTPLRAPENEAVWFYGYLEGNMNKYKLIEIVK